MIVNFNNIVLIGVARSFLVGYVLSHHTRVSCHMTMLKVFLLVYALGAVYCKLNVDFQASKITQLEGQKDVNKFIQSSNVRIVYFYKKDVKFLNFFFKELEKSTQFLEMYGVKTGFCNCTENHAKKVQDCKKDGVENSVHTFRSGSSLLSLELETMFDVNSIMSNILQLVMLRDVPILQTSKEVLKFLGTMRGKKDVVFGHMKAIGTFDHRVFMEVAYAYLNHLQFVICTDKKATKLFEQPTATGKEMSTIWWVWTKNMSPEDDSYHNIRYHGELNLKALASFVKTITKPKIFNMPAEGLEDPYTSVDIPVVRFYYDTVSEADVNQKATRLTKYYGGHVGVVLINMDHENASKVTSYQGRLPTMSFQHDDRAVEQFLPATMKLTTDHIGRFMDLNMGSEPVRAGEPEEVETEDDRAVEEEPDEQWEAPPFNYEDVEKQDDSVAEMVEKTKKIMMPLDLVQGLTDKTFPVAVKDSNVAAILLYFPFDAVSMGNLRMFGEAAERLGKLTTLKIGSVNCYDWTDVCQKENIIIYPTLRVYKKGEKAWDYKGPQDTMAMFATLKLLEMSPPVYEKDSDKLLQYLTGQGDSTLKGIINTTVVGLFRKGDKQEKEIFQQLAMNSRDRIMFVYTDVKETSVIADKFGSSLPTVILAKHDDAIQPYVKFSSQFTLPDLQDFVENNKLPKLTVLTPLMFPEVRKKFSQLLILFTDGSEISQHSEDTVRDIVKTQQFNNVSFNMMQVADHSSIGYRVLQQYTSEPEVPHLSLVKFQKGEVFNFAARDLNKDSVTDWLSNVVEGSIEPSTKLKDKDWKPKSKGYEFLKIIDWEAKNRKEEKPRSDVPDDVPENTEGKKHKSPGAYFDSLEDDEKAVTMEEDDDTGTRRDLFALKDSRLYHQAPGRVHHHGDRKDKGSHSVDEGYSSDEHVEGEAVEESDKQHKRHDPSEL